MKIAEDGLPKQVDLIYNDIYENDPRFLEKYNSISKVPLFFIDSKGYGDAEFNRK